MRKAESTLVGGRTVIQESCLPPRRSAPWHPATVSSWAQRGKLRARRSFLRYGVPHALLHRHLSVWTPFCPAHWLLILAVWLPSTANNKWCLNLCVLEVSYHPISCISSLFPHHHPAPASTLDIHISPHCLPTHSAILYSQHGIGYPPSNLPALSLLSGPALCSHLEKRLLLVSLPGSSQLQKKTPMFASFKKVFSGHIQAPSTRLSKSACSVYIHCLCFPRPLQDVLFTITHSERSLEPPNIIIDVAVSSFGSIRFCFTYFEALLLGP